MPPSKTLPPDTILAVVHDGHNMHCLTEACLDEWFRSLDVERKAAHYVADMDGVLDDPPVPSSRHPEVKTLEEHAARFLYDMQKTMNAPILGFGEKVRRA